VIVTVPVEVAPSDPCVAAWAALAQQASASAVLPKSSREDVIRIIQDSRRRYCGASS